LGITLPPVTYRPCGSLFFLQDRPSFPFFSTKEWSGPSFFYFGGSRFFVRGDDTSGALFFSFARKSFFLSSLTLGLARSDFHHSSPPSQFVIRGSSPGVRANIESWLFFLVEQVFGTISLPQSEDFPGPRFSRFAAKVRTFLEEEDYLPLCGLVTLSDFFTQRYGAGFPSSLAELYREGDAPVCVEKR